MLANPAFRGLKSRLFFAQGPKMPEYKHTDGRRQIDVIAVLIDLFDQSGQAKPAVVGDLAQPVPEFVFQ